MMLTVRKARQVLWGLLCLVLLSALAVGCAPAAQAPGAAPPKAITPQYGGVLQMATTQRLQTLNFNTGGTIGEYVVLGLVYERLVNFAYKFVDGKMEDWTAAYPIAPWLAERWEQPNPTTYVFYLRKGVKWHDGVEFTADDVVWSYEYGLDPKNSFRVRGNLITIDKVEKVDQYTLRLTTKGPSPDLLQNLADFTAVIMPKHVIDRGDKYEKVTIGTGPLKLKSFDPDRGAELVKNENYYESGKPYLDGVKVIYGLDISGQVAAFKTGQTDINHIDDKAQFDAIKALKGDIQYDTFNTNYGWGLKPRMDSPPYNDLRVRRAINLAIDRQAINRSLGFNLAILNGFAIAGTKKIWMPPEAELLKREGFRQPKGEDIALAKRLLAEAGYPEGFKTTMNEAAARVWTPSMVEAACGQLKVIGVECKLNLLERGMFNNKEKEGDYDLSHMYTTGFRPTAQWTNYLHSQGAMNKGFGINDPKLDELIEKQALTMDAAERKRMILEMDKIIYENVYYIPLVDPATFASWQPWVHDYVYNIGASHYLVQPSWIWLEKDKIPSR